MRRIAATRDEMILAQKAEAEPAAQLTAGSTPAATPVPQTETAKR